jgi:hypothetical protein
MPAQSSAATRPNQIVTVDDLRPNRPQSELRLRLHQKIAAVCFAAVGLIATVGWFYLIATALRAVVRWF